MHMALGSGYDPGCESEIPQKRFMFDFGGHRFNVFKSPEQAPLIAISGLFVRVIV